MASRISLFNHKGGVSKTTTTFNLGWMLASLGYKVIIADCDPQCNLTGMVTGLKGASSLQALYSKPGVTNIRDGLAPAFESRPSPIVAVDCEPVPNQPNLFLLPGHIGLSEYEVTLGIAQELSGTLVTLQNLPGSISHLFEITAQKYNADYVLVDMSPSLGPINQNLLMTGDYFLIPMNPDFFSAMAIDSLASILPKWKAWSLEAQRQPILRNSSYPFPIKHPKFLGTIIQKYKLREMDKPSAAFQAWINEIEKGVIQTLIPVINAHDMAISSDKYTEAGVDPKKPILQMSDFNGLIALSQKHQAPIFDLTDQQLEQKGIVLDRTKLSMEEFKKLYKEGTERIIKLTNP